MVCYLARHGQDDETIRRGWRDHPLTDTGIQQSEELAKKFASMMENDKIHGIYSSDLRRAMQTAQILAEKLCLPVVPLAQFREVNSGDLAGMQNDTALIQYPGLFWNQLRWDQPYPNGESPRQFYERMRDIFNSAGIVRPAILIDGNVAGWWNLKDHKLTVTMFGNCNGDVVAECAWSLWPDIKKMDFK